MYETDSDQSRQCREFPHSWLLNQGRRMLVIFEQEEPKPCVSGFVLEW